MTGRALARRIATLDPVSDHEELAHLSVEVRYGDAMFVHAAYTVAFARQVAIPSIARIVYRTGTGDMMQNVRRRNDDTLVYFGEMLRNGHSSADGRAVIDRMEQIHARFGISADDKLYTLGSLAFEAERILQHLGVDVVTDPERIALYHFWRGVGEYMGLDVPASRAGFYAWTLDYERRQFATTSAGRDLVDQLFRDWRTRWFPGPLQRFADPTLLSLLDQRLRDVHHLPAPPRRLSRHASRLVRPYLWLQATRPHRPTRSWSDHFGTDHPRPLDITAVGHQPAAKQRRNSDWQPSAQAR